MAKKKKKYYVVWAGHTPGIYNTWAECQAETKGYAGARFKSYTSRAEAEAAYAGGPGDIGGGGATSPRYSGRPTKPTLDTIGVDQMRRIAWDSICVDAACSGNPGDMEYRGVVTQTGEEIFRKGPFKKGTNNVGEFLALVHGLALLQQRGEPTKPIYSDSRIAMGWVRKKKCNTTLARSRANENLHILIKRAEQWLKSNTYQNPILKWDTKNWGEIPADFGRK